MFHILSTLDYDSHPLPGWILEHSPIQYTCRTVRYGGPKILAIVPGSSLSAYHPQNESWRVVSYHSPGQSIYRFGVDKRASDDTEGVPNANILAERCWLAVVGGTPIKGELGPPGDWWPCSWRNRRIRGKRTGRVPKTG